MLKLFRSFILACCLSLMAATAFAAQVQVEPSVHPQQQDITLPVVTVPDNPQASAAINAQITKNIETFINQSDECYKVDTPHA